MHTGVCGIPIDFSAGVNNVLIWTFLHSFSLKINPLCCLFLIAPTDPRNLTATPGRAGVTIMWLPPTQPNGNVSYSYTVNVTGTNSLVNSRATTYESVTITDLNPFTNYTVTVIAVTLGGTSNPVSNTFVTLQGSMLQVV